MSQFIKCDVCDLYFNITRSKLKISDGICTECATSDKLRIPVLILKRVQKRNNANCLSDFEEFTLYYSKLLDNFHSDDRVMKQLKRKLRRKFE